MNACPLKSGIVLGHLLPPFLFNKVFKPQQDRKRNKRVTNGKGRSPITSLSGQHNHTLKEMVSVKNQTQEDKYCMFFVCGIYARAYILCVHVCMCAHTHVCL